MKKLAILLLLSPLFCFSQIDKAKTILIKNVSFDEISAALLNQGYVFEKRGNEFQYVRTQTKKFPDLFNGKYRFAVRVIDSTAYLNAFYSNAIYKDAPAWYKLDKNGQPLDKTLAVYPFMLALQFAKSLQKEIDYSLN